MKQTAGQPPKLLKKPEAAGQLDISVRSLEYMIERGDIAVVRLPGKNQAWAVRVEQAEIERFIAGYRQPAGQ